MLENYKLSNILFLDVETAPVIYKYNDLSENIRQLWDSKFRYSTSESPESQYKKAGVYAEFAKVVCISMGNFYNGKFYIKSFTSTDEKEILTQFSEHLAKFYNSDDNNLCAHNGKEFDFPFLCRRFLINRMNLPKILSISGKKPWEVKLLDTMEMWKFGDYKNYTSLNLLAHVFNLPSPKDEIDGSDVARVFWEEKDLEKIKKYCGKDVITLANVFCMLNTHEPIANENVVFVN